jgi:hypothetical protein
MIKVRLRDKSGIRLFRYLVEDVDRHGNVRIYFRRKGRPKIRLRELPGTAAFDAEYQRAFSGELKPPSAHQHTLAMPGTMRWLCAQYYASPKFQSLAASTRKVRRGILEEICQRAGNFRYAVMETPRTLRSCAMKRQPFPTRSITASRRCGSYSHGRCRPSMAMPKGIRRGTLGTCAAPTLMASEHGPKPTRCAMRRTIRSAPRPAGLRSVTLHRGAPQ